MSLEDLERRVAALEAAAASAPLPEPPPERLTFLTNWIVGYVGSALTRDHAESLARALLTRPETQRVLAPAPMEWPVLPPVPPHPSDECTDSSYRRGWCHAWGRACDTLAAMNPNPQWEGRNDG